ncbi:Transcription factor TFIIIB component B [Ptychographa xylographoides]|nr:Transcription factor TFIIIB component B [Ptychographa xylographoides]
MSYLSKSKKDFKPKAPTRRQGPITVAPGSSQTSLRGSVERQVPPQTQTPQPSTAQSVAASTATNHGGPTLQHSIDVNANRVTSQQQRIPESIAIATPVRSTQAVSPSPISLAETIDSAQVSHQAVPFDTQSTPSKNVFAINIPTTRHSVIRRQTSKSTVNTIRTSNAPPQAPSTLKAPGPPIVIHNEVTGAGDGESTQHAKKRRKISTPRKVVADDQLASSQTTTTPVAPPIEPVQEAIIATSTILGAKKSSTAKPPKQKGKPSIAKVRQQMKDAAAGLVANAAQDSRDDDDDELGTRRRKKAAGGRKRARTPSDAESHMIEPGIVTMADLCRDGRTGKISKREKALQERDAKELMRKQQEGEHSTEDAQTAISTADIEPAGVIDPVSGPASSRAPAPTIRVVNGQIVHDEGSRTIDRVAMANEARGNNEVVVVVDSLSHKVNSHTYGKKGRLPKWNEEMTDRFYDGLRMFGTDFEMIAKMFPEKTRRTIKLKFVKEEKLDKEKIKATLLGDRIPVDMEAYSKMANTVFRDPAELEQDMADDRRRLEEEQAREKEAMDETVRHRAEEAAAEAAAEDSTFAAGEDSSAKENEAQSAEVVGVGSKQGNKKAHKRAATAKRKTAITKPKSPKAVRITPGVLQPTQ